MKLRTVFLHLNILFCVQIVTEGPLLSFFCHCNTIFHSNMDALDEFNLCLDSYHEQS